ncbi:MAG: hypothetical protein IPL96_12420 [Holophagaceae bacterium]|nr:hypothetical protein [Holophagaceae bacterium]
MTIDFSFLVPSTGRAEGLDRVLSALPAALGRRTFELLGACPAADAATRAVFAAHGARVVLDDAPFKGSLGGFSWPGALQALLEAAQGRWFCYGSDDVLFPRDALSGAMTVAALLGAAGVSLGQVERWPGRPDRGPFAMRSLNRPMVNYGVLSRDAALAAGGFDTWYDFYAADWDLCLRIQAAGGVLVEVPDVAVLHEVVEDGARSEADRRRDADEIRYADRWLAHPFARTTNNLSSVVPKPQMRAQLYALLPTFVARGKAQAAAEGSDWDAQVARALEEFPEWETVRWISSAGRGR